MNSRFVKRFALPLAGGILFWTQISSPALAGETVRRTATLKEAIASESQVNYKPVAQTIPVGAPRATIVMVHGTTQHAGSFAVLANKLKEQGFAVIACDLRGHGHRYHDADVTAADRRVNYEKSAVDLAKVLVDLRKKNPNGKLFALGESVGAGVATRAVGLVPGTVDGLILCSAGTRPCLTKFNPVMVAGDFCKYIWRVDHSMDVTRYILKYSSDDHRVSEEMVSDPLSRVTLTGREVLKTGWFIRKTPDAAKQVSAETPVLIVQADSDGIVSGRSVKAILKNLPSKDKEMAVIPNSGHVLMGTSFLKPPVVAKLTDWLKEHSPAPGVVTTVTAKLQPEPARTEQQDDQAPVPLRKSALNTMSISSDGMLLPIIVHARTTPTSGPAQHKSSQL